MTLEGTNTWVLAEPGSTEAVVVDPGPLDEGHLTAVRAAADVIGARVTLILLTHRHRDHSAGAHRFHELTGAPVRALDPEHQIGGDGLSGGDRLDVGGLRLSVLPTPGHTGDSLSFVIDEDAAVLTGDTVLGRGTTVVAHPDGRLGDYLASLHRLREQAEQGRIETILPGHGPVLPDALAATRAYLAHRAERLAEVKEAVTAGATSPMDVVRRVYADVDPVLWPAAELSVRAQLDYLTELGG
jgi:glyoxylase-like metal-dependent hydrolase (beta-lactamase superfamily II)